MSVRQKTFVTSCLVSLFASLVGTGWSEPTQAQPWGELTPEQQAILEQAEILIAVPTYLPEFTQVDFVEATPPGVGVMEGGDYLIYYRQPQLTGGETACFEIEAARGGFGGPVPEQAMPAELPSFAQPLTDHEDYEYQIYWTDTGEPDGPFPQPMLFSDWIQGEDAYYRITSQLGRYCDVLSPEEANRILRSLTYLPASQ